MARLNWGKNSMVNNFVSQDRDEQTQLEMKHRQEEDDLYRKFARQRDEEDKRIRDEIQVIQIFNLIRNKRCMELLNTG